MLVEVLDAFVRFDFELFVVIVCTEGKEDGDCIRIIHIGRTLRLQCLVLLVDVRDCGVALCIEP